MPKSHATATQQPLDITPVDMHYCGNYIRILEVWKPICKPDILRATTWEQYMDSLPEWDRSLIAKPFIIDKDSLLQTLKEGKELILCSDRGTDKHNGSYGSIIAIKNQLLISTDKVTVISG